MSVLGLFNNTLIVSMEKWHNGNQRSRVLVRQAWFSYSVNCCTVCRFSMPSQLAEEFWIKVFRLTWAVDCTESIILQSEVPLVFIILLNVPQISLYLWYQLCNMMGMEQRPLYLLGNSPSENRTWVAATSCWPLSIFRKEVKEDTGLRLKSRPILKTIQSNCLTL